MRYFLDFDRTIFDTPSFKRSLAAHPSIGQLGQQLKEAIQETVGPASSRQKWQILGESIGAFLSTGRFIFVPDELKKYLYPDVPDFLIAHGHKCTVVTYGVQAFIMAKVTSALSDFTLDAIVYTSRRKGRTIRRLCERETGPYVFVDDAHFQLASVAKWCPFVSIYEIRRDEKPANGRWPVVRTLTELPLSSA